MATKKGGALKYYVYELIDPRTGEAFYVGKGCGNRCSQHESDARAGRIGNVEKHRRIKSIHDDGLSVTVRIVSRHKKESEAFAAERFLIEGRKDSLTNIVLGVCTNDEKWAMTARAALIKMLPFDVWMNRVSNEVRIALGGTDEKLRAFHDGHRVFLERMTSVVEV